MKNIIRSSRHVSKSIILSCIILLYIFIIHIVSLYASVFASVTPTLWSTEGEWIAFSCSTTDENGFGSNIYLVRPDGTQITKLTDDNSAALSPIWSPDGEWLLYVDKSRIFRVSSDGTQLDEMVDKLVIEGLQSAVISPSGDKLVFVVSYTHSSSIAIYDILSESYSTLTTINGSISSIDWYSDSERLAFSVISANRGPIIYNISIYSRNYEQLFSEIGIFRGLDISASSLLTYAILWNRSTTLFTIDLETNERLRLYDIPNAYSPSWSPDSSEIAFAGNSSEYSNGIYRLEANGAVTNVIGLLDCYPSSPQWFSYDL